MKGLLCLLIFAVIAGIIGLLGCFFYIFGKGKTSDLRTGAEKSPWKAYTEDIRKGIEWIDSQNWENWEITSHDNLRLCGRYLKQENSDTTFLLVHGYHSTDYNDFCCIAKKVYEEGYSVLLIDQRAHGQSEGSFVTFAVKERFDVVDWVNEIAKRKGEKEQIVLWGISMGATSVLLSCGLNLSRQVKCVVADCGFTSAWDVVGCTMDGMKLPKGFILPPLDILCKQIGKFSMKEADTIEVMTTNTIPVFFSHGTGDDFVPCEMSKKAYDACIADKYFFSVNDVWHAECFFADPAGYWDALCPFLNKYLQ